MRPLYYILDKDKKPVACTLEEMSLYYENYSTDRIVKQEKIYNGEKEYKVSTVFLGIDHSHSLDGPPILFETMIFIDDKGNECYCTRCSTYEDALEMHEKAKAYIFELNQ